MLWFLAAADEAADDGLDLERCVAVDDDEDELFLLLLVVDWDWDWDWLVT